MVRNPQCSCPYTQTLFLTIGKKWTLFILQSVKEGNNSFTEIRNSIGEANTKILTDRLAELVEMNILQKNENGKYFLSPIGEELMKKLSDILEWWCEEQCNIIEKSS